MQSDGETKRRNLFGKVFEPKVDFYALLSQQANKTLEGMEALAEWMRSDSNERCQTVRVLEEEADQLKFQLGQKLVESFVTPIDREDIYDLSGRLDEVINAAKATLREME